MAERHPTTARRVISDTLARWRTNEARSAHDWTGLTNELLADLRASGFPLTLPQEDT